MVNSGTKPAENKFEIQYTHEQVQVQLQVQLKNMQS